MDSKLIFFDIDGTLAMELRDYTRQYQDRHCRGKEKRASGVR